MSTQGPPTLGDPPSVPDLLALPRARCSVPCPAAACASPTPCAMLAGGFLSCSEDRVLAALASSTAGILMLGAGG